MQDARYGRMRLNRCVKLDFGYIGCSSEVLHILDRKCSGKSECELRIPDPELDATQPCVDDLTRYLDASFLCIAGEVDGPRNEMLSFLYASNRLLSLGGIKTRQETAKLPWGGNGMLIENVSDTIASEAVGMESA